MPNSLAGPQRLTGLDQISLSGVVATANALENGRVEEAQSRLAPILAQYPHHAEVLRLHAGIESLCGRNERAIFAIRAAVSQRPKDALYHNTLGTVLAEAGEYDDAITALRHCCALQPDLAIAWFNLGIMLTRCVRNDEAIVALRQAVTIDPRHASARVLLADMLRVGNRAAEAEAEYRRILTERPYAGIAWWGLADLKTTKFAAGDVERMRGALADLRAGDDDRIATGFALAKALDDEGRYAESLDSLAYAHMIARRRKHWNANAFSVGMATIRAAFDRATEVRVGEFGKGVIFIVSLPRSGSTLVEHILASHPDVEGAGELTDLPLIINEESRRFGQSFPNWVEEMTLADWNRMGEKYLKRTARWRTRRPFFTDKLPNNWFYIDVIRRILPAARIVVCRRDPLETCFSCYRQYLYNNEYTRTFDDLAAYWTEFDQSARVALAHYPSHVHENILESLIDEPEKHIRRLLKFCELPFNTACLEFNTTERDVRSPSAMQVREPLKRAVRRSCTYGPLLDPLRTALRRSDSWVR